MKVHSIFVLVLTVVTKVLEY